jgi:hypothetical protein
LVTREDVPDLLSDTEIVKTEAKAKDPLEEEKVQDESLIKSGMSGNSGYEKLEAPQGKRTSGRFGVEPPSPSQATELEASSLADFFGQRLSLGVLMKINPKN